MWATIVRCIWEQRNKVVFKQGVLDADEMFQYAQLLSWLWLKHRVCSFLSMFSLCPMNGLEDRVQGRFLLWSLLVQGRFLFRSLPTQGRFLFWYLHENMLNQEQRKIMQVQSRTKNAQPRAQKLVQPRAKKNNGSSIKN